MTDTLPLDALTEAQRQQRFLMEAATATSFESGHQIELQLGHYCNNRCVFCVSGQLTEEGNAKPIHDAPIIAALEDAASKGIRRVTFLGGEPTIQASFLPALERAIALGFNDIVIFTNGARGKSDRFMEKVLSLGRFTWRFSLQGANEAAHERVTMRKRSWRRIIAAIEFLAARGQDITANMCVNEHSYRSLPEFPELLAKHGIQQLHIDMLRPNNTGQRDDAYLRSILPKHSDMQPYIRQMLERFEDWDPEFDINIGNYPYCQLADWSHKIHHGGEPTMTLTTGHKGELDRILRKYDYQRLDAHYGPGCPECVFYAQCRGVPEKYAAFYGTDELVPVTADALTRIDRHQRAFTLLLVEDFQQLLAAPPDGATGVELFADSRERRIELRIAWANAASTTVVVSPVVDPPRSAPPALLVGPRFQLGVTTDFPSKQHGVEVVRWLRATFTTEHPHGPLRAGKPRRSWVVTREQARATGEWVAAQPLPAELASWKASPPRARSSNDGVSVAWRDADGRAVRLEVFATPLGKLGARVDLGPATTRRDAEAVVTFAQATLARAPARP